MTTLHQLYGEQGQSPWLDNLRRDYLRGGHLQSLVDQGIRGVTSNPTIFAKAIESLSDYDEQFADLLADHDVDGAYWELVISDILDACTILHPVHEASAGKDGFISVEVAPSLAHDSAATAAAAKHLHDRISRPNVLVKIPATAEGIPAIREAIGSGISVNVTLIFSLERYGDVMNAYISGLEDLHKSGVADLSKLQGVASFFVSRVDTEVDRRLESLAANTTDSASKVALLDARGKAAVAQAQQAYEQFKKTFSGPRWEALHSAGAIAQRPLWASTSTKNPAYPDLLYVDSLIGPDTVNTMPDATVDAFLDHGTPKRTIDLDPSESSGALAHLGELGVDLADVAKVLEDEGVASFAKSFDELLQSLSDKANTLAGGN